MSIGCTRVLGFIGCVLALAAACSRADELPEQTIRVVVPLTAGSSLDARARVIVDALGQRLKRRVIVDNRPGAGGTIGTGQWPGRSRTDRRCCSPTTAS